MDSFQPSDSFDCNIPPAGVIGGGRILRPCLKPSLPIQTTTHHANSSTNKDSCRLLELPYELRHTIWKYIIDENVCITLDERKLARRNYQAPGYGELSCFDKERSPELPIDAEDMLSAIHQGDIDKVALLRTCRFVREDAAIILAGRSIVNMQTYRDRGQDRLLMITEPSILRHIRAIHIPAEQLLRLRASHLPRLEKVYMSPKITDPSPLLPCIEKTMWQVIHRDPEAQRYWHNFWNSTTKDRTKSRVISEAQKHGWALHFSTRLRFQHPGPSCGRLEMEFQYDFESGQLISKRILEEQRVLLENEEWEDLNLIREKGFRTELYRGNKSEARDDEEVYRRYGKHVLVRRRKGKGGKEWRPAFKAKVWY